MCLVVFSFNVPLTYLDMHFLHVHFLLFIFIQGLTIYCPCASAYMVFGIDTDKHVTSKLFLLNQILRHDFFFFCYMNLGPQQYHL